MDEVEYQEIEFLEIEEEAAIQKPLKVFRCSICNFINDKASGLKKHLLIHENGKRPCKICGKNFYHTRMIYHLLTSHKDVKESESILKEFMDNEKKMCPICDTRFSLEALENHLLDLDGNCSIGVGQNQIRSSTTRKDEIYKCEICPSSFSNFRNYYRHEKMHEKGTVQCKICQKHLLEIDMKYHLDSHPNLDNVKVEIELKCKFCLKIFNHHQSFVHRRHESFHEAGRKFCKLCEKFYSDEKDFEWHMQNIHPKTVEIVKEETKSISDDVVRVPEETEDDEMTDEEGDDEYCDPIKASNEQFSCSYCSKGFGRRFTLNRHEKIHSSSGKMFCKVCDRFMTPTEMKIHNQEGHYTRKKTHCQYCSKGFTRNYVRKRHEQQHEIGKQFCTDCNKFYLPEDMNWHMTHVHSEAGQKAGLLKCPKCPKLFTKMEYRSSHEKAMHVENDEEDNEMKYVTSIEPDHNYTLPSDKRIAKFEVNTSEYQEIVEIEALDDESLLMAGGGLIENDEKSPESQTNCFEKRYKCQLCPIQFESRFELLRHIKRVHEISQKEPCPLCGKNYKTEKIGEHLAKIHNYNILEEEKGENEAESSKYFYKCGICPKVFTRQFARNRHRQLHENGRKQCKFCKKMFKESKFVLHSIKCKYHNLVKDVTIDQPNELEEKTCPICSMVVSQKKDLPRHMMIHSKISCQICEKPVLEISIDEHMKTKHPENVIVEVD